MSLVATLIARTAEARAPSFWNANPFMRRFWFLAFYSGIQIRRDLNVIVGHGKTWKIPVFLPILLRYIPDPFWQSYIHFVSPRFTPYATILRASFSQPLQLLLFWLAL